MTRAPLGQALARAAASRRAALVRNPPVEMVGQRFGRWLVLERAEPLSKIDHNRGARWRCRCDCGHVGTVMGRSLRNGKSKSCGCIRVETNRRRWAEGGDLRTRYLMRTG